MTHLLRLGTATGRLTCLLVMALAAVYVFSSPCFGQLSVDEIEALQERAKEEGWTFEIGWTPACERSMDELCGFNPELAPEDDAKLMDPVVLSDRDLPVRFDWRDSATLPPARDQAQCGSCWAFATVGSLECLIAMKNGEVVDLSEQWLINCNPYGYDCDNGGFTVPQMFLNVGDDCGRTGAVMEYDLPYIEDVGTCDCPYSYYYWIDSYANVTPTVSNIKNAIVEYGPVMVSVRAEDDTWQGFSGGVFNACAGGPTNHAVVLVGWDDTQGSAGVWFLRNSWGPGWGEDGYMRIEYGCSSVGNNCKRMCYQPIFAEASPQLTSLPATVDFSVEAPYDSITDATWFFGDGGWAYGAEAQHEYLSTGVYDVEVSVETDHVEIDSVYEQMIIVHCDTMQMSEETAYAGSEVGVEIRLRNALDISRIQLPFRWVGDFGMSWDSVSMVGSRADYFTFTWLNPPHPVPKRGCFELNCPTGESELGPGNGLIATLWFTVPGGTSPGTNPVEFYPYASYAPLVECIGGSYSPELTDGLVEVPDGCCVNLRGNVDGSLDDAVSLGDLTVMIDHLFVSFEDLLCWEEANVDGSQPEGSTSISLGDLTVLIDILFVSFQDPIPCP